MRKSSLPSLRVIVGSEFPMPDRHAQRFLPMLGHLDDHTGVTRKGTVYSVLHVAGHSAELDSAAQIDGALGRMNKIMQNVSDPRLEWWRSFTRMGGQRPHALPPCKSWFARELDEAYTARCLTGLFRNDLFVSIVFNPDDGVLEALKALGHAVNPLRLFRRPMRDLPSVAARFLRDFEETRSMVIEGLSRYGVKPLGIRWEGEVPYSEIHEAFHQIANNHFRKIPITLDPIGRAVVPDRIEIGWDALRVMVPGRPRFCAFLSFLGYPPRTNPLMFEPFSRVPYSVVVTDSGVFTQRARSLDRLALKVKMMMSSEDKARKQVAQLEEVQGDVMAGEYVMVNHHNSVAVWGDSLEDVDRNIGRAQTALSDVGVSVIRADYRSLKCELYSQIPVNRRWRTRPGGVKSYNFADLTALNNVPIGSYKGRWGGPLMIMRTSADTEYAFQFHVTGVPSIPAEDMASFSIVGGAGSGKTSLVAQMMACSERQGARCAMIDKDYGLAPFILASGGSYSALKDGEPSDYNPLIGLADTPADLTFAENFTRCLIMSDGKGSLSATEDAVLQRAISLQMRMPKEMRSFEGVASMLEGGASPGEKHSAEPAAARLRKWCRGQRLGWAFDNPKDSINLSTRLVGFDTTSLLKNELVTGPMLTYLFYRISKMVDGTPFVLSVDECWQAFRVPAFVDFANDLLKTIRKNEGAVGLLTQSVADLLNSDIKHTIRQQVPTKIFFGDEQADDQEFMDGFSLTWPEFRAVKQVLPTMRHSFLIKRPGGSVICRSDMSAIKSKVAVLSGRRTTYELALDLIERHGPSPEDWVPHYERLAPILAETPPKTKELENA